MNQAGYNHIHRPGFGKDFGPNEAHIKIWPEEREKPNLNQDFIRHIKIAGTSERRNLDRKQQVEHEGKELRQRLSKGEEIYGHVFNDQVAQRFVFFMKSEPDPETGNIN